MILHIPHSSTDTNGQKYLRDITLDINYLTDWFTDDLFEYDATRLVYPYSRFVCDVERLENDLMEAKGQGIFYTHGIDGTPIRELSATYIEVMKFELYDSFKRKFVDAIELGLQSAPQVIVDCHSFTSEDLDDTDFCIGINDSNVPVELLERFKLLLSVNGYSQAINKPYAGCILPEQFVNRAGAYAVMIEVNKKLYLTKELTKSDSYVTTKNIITGLLDIVREWEGSI